MKSTKVKRLGAGRVAFLARIEIFKEKIIAGHTIASVFEEHEKELGGIGYKQFVNYVNKFIRSKSSGDNDRAAAEKDSKEKRPIRTREPGQAAFISSDTPRDRASLVKRKE